MALIRINQLTKRYVNGADCVTALQQLDLTVDEGCFLGVMGPSGSGKSTLLSVLGGLCRPTSGSVVIDGIDLYDLPPERQADFRREFLGFIFQAHNLIPYLNAMENVMLPLAVARLTASEKRQRARAVLGRVGLAHRMLHLPQQLSGGEQERVAIARALVNSPPLLLADEPTGSLDSATSLQIMELLDGLIRDGKTIVMVTHNTENISWFDRTLTLRDGQLVEDSGPARVGLPRAV